jgi:preprotein translocase subunit SecF
VFDRLRENIRAYPNRTLARNANISIMESLGRSLNTSLTLLFTIVALIVVGGETIRIFLYVLLIGVVAGTYSSIGIATPFLVIWEEGFFGRLFRRSSSDASATEAANA